LFFTFPEYAMIEGLIDIIIPDDGTPGAREAGGSEFIDLMISCHQPFRPNPRCTGTSVCDASVFLNCTDKTTTLSILAFILRTSEYLVQQVRHGNL
jgi:Gluconate 2-dehydrogenase subunit 3